MKAQLIAGVVVLSVMFELGSGIMCRVGFELIEGSETQSNFTSVRCPDDVGYLCRRAEAVFERDGRFSSSLSTGGCARLDQCSSCDTFDTHESLPSNLTRRFCRSACCGEDNCNIRPVAVLGQSGQALRPASFRPCSRADIALFIDTSGSISSERFELVRCFVEFLAPRLDLGRDYIRISLQSFNLGVASFGNFIRSEGKRSLIEQVRNIRYTGGRKRISRVFTYARDYLFSDDQGDRPDAPDMLIVFTDGRSRYNPRALRRLKRRGIRVAIVTVGDRIDRRQANAIASDPDRENVFDLDDVDRLVDVIEEFSRAECPTGPRCYLGRRRSGAAENQDGVEIRRCLVGQSCLGIDAIVNSEGRKTFLYTGTCVPSFVCGNIECTDVAADVSQESVERCDVRCCDDDLCNGPSIDPTHQVEIDTVTCFAGEAVSGTGTLFDGDRTRQLECDPGFQCASLTYTVTSPTGRHVTIYFNGSCIPSSSCSSDIPSNVCENLRSSTFDRTVNCRTSCCDSDLCNQPPALSTETPTESTGCFTGTQASIVEGEILFNKLVSRECSDGLTCVKISATAILSGNLILLNYGECISTISCQAIQRTSCDQLQTQFPLFRTFGSQFINCQVNC